MIISAQLTESGGYKVKLASGSLLDVPNNSANRHYKMVKEWISDGGVVDPYIAPTPSTDDEMFQKLIQNDQFRALIMALAKKAGFTSKAELLTAYKAEL